MNWREDGDGRVDGLASAFGSFAGRERRVQMRRAAHLWPQPLPATWCGQLDRPEPLRYHQVEPTVVAEVT